MTENKEPIPVRTEYHFQPGDVLTFPDEPEAAGRRFAVMRGTGTNIDCGECDICFIGNPFGDPFLDCETCWRLLRCHSTNVYFKEIKQKEQP